MKTSWFLLATVASLHLSACGGQSASEADDSAERDPDDEQESSGEDDGTMESSKGEDSAGSGEGVPPVEDIDEDGDVDEDDAELNAIEEVFGIDVKDVDNDGDIDQDDAIEILGEEYDEDELDQDGDGDFDQQDIEQVRDLVPSSDQPMAVEMPGVAVNEPLPAAASMPDIAPAVPRPPRAAGPGILIDPGFGGGSSGSFPDLDTCEQDYVSTGPDYCDVSYSCDVTYAYGSCWNQGNGLLYCNCSSEIGYADYQLQDVSTSDACNTLMELCDGGISPEFSEEAECVPEYQSASNDYCDMQLRCSQSAELDGGGTALLSQYESVNCGLDQDGDHRCTCYGSNGTMSFTQGASDGLDSCVSGLEICQTAEVVETDEPAECEVAYQSASQTWCDAQLACKKTAVAGDVTVEIAETAVTNCQQTSEGMWTCWCTSSTESSTFELETAATAWDTCTQAVDRCAQ